MECFRCKKKDVTLNLWTHADGSNPKQACSFCIKYLGQQRKSHNKHAKKRNAWCINNNRTRNWAGAIIARVNEETKKRSRPCDIDKEHILSLFETQCGKCYWTGLEMTPSSIHRYPGRPSLDKLVPDHGYVKGNCVLACMFINIGRSNATAEVFQKYLDDNGLSRAKNSE